jgi:TetR/AcrR family transcriptional repressor of nem operon
MARPRTFDEGAVLDTVMDRFWHSGYTSTSVRDLADVTGLSLPSLYNAFGDKSELFQVALERYFKRNTRPRLEQMVASPDPLKAMRRFFAELVDRAITDPDRRGCLLINSAVELAARDDELAPVIREYLARIESYFRRVLEAAKARGEIAKTSSPRDLARLLLSLVAGIRVLARSRPERAVLESVVGTAMDAIEHAR